ncbi:ABC transporter ATP-binding protein [Saccharibacillus sp. O23]|uniref:ATP-binding cassette domain-containing protein n=1 Tax=Saccharibacillus sp. O23 TaxID=2009338 RepID=UPI000B4DF40F|nr:ATP-binding cassette domain-containing protein [Saccharibacillus sp. O23]OWR30344.1 ABC transporter ATP-binding protein [Saccharibacillus sp. O23]
MLEVKQVSKRYDGGRGVRHIDFSMQRGEIVGFLGPNGAGKTTTMRMITGYLYPTEGTITVDGLSVHDEARRARSKIGYLPETPPLYPDLTVEAYLKFVAKLRDVPAREQKLRVAEMVSRLGLGGRERQSIRHLSKGYKQRLGLAQAIIHKPDLLVLDEPTSGLDPSQIIEIRSLIRELGENHTVLLSTHILQEVGALCDRVLIINRGELVMDGAPNEIGARMENRFVVSVEVRGERERVERVLGEWAAERGIVAEIKQESDTAKESAERDVPTSSEETSDETSAKLEAGSADEALAAAPTVETSEPPSESAVQPVVIDSPAAAEISELAAQSGSADALSEKETETSVEAVQVVDLSEEPAQAIEPDFSASSIPQPIAGVRAVLTASGQEDFRVELFRLLAEADLPILELHKENLTLEDVFIKLTEGEKASAANVGDLAVSPTESGGERA